MSEAPVVSVVLPVYNEATHLTEEIDRIKRALDSSPYAYEIVVIDDGSTDGSGELLRAIEGVRVIRFSSNRGSGTARRIGTEAARGQVVVWTDVDMTYPNDDIPRLVKELEGFDQVVGARRTEEGTAKLLRVPVKWFIRKLASYLAATSIPDLNSGFRAFRRDVALQFVDMLPKGFSCVTTMTMTFLANGYTVKYVPIDYMPRAGDSKFHWRKDTQQYLTQVVRLVMSYDPLRFFVPLGVALMLLGLGKLSYDLVAHPLRVAANTLLIFFAAFQTFAIGLIADLVVRLHRRSHDVPPATF
jgi:glycosyltransferase involved in cell wall biosynthesis